MTERSGSDVRRPLLLFLLFLVGVANSAPVGAQSRPLAQGDRISLIVLDHPELSATAEVAADGFLRMPTLEGIRIPAVGRSVENLLEDLSSFVIGLVGTASVAISVTPAGGPTPLVDPEDEVLGGRLSDSEAQDTRQLVDESGPVSEIAAAVVGVMLVLGLYLGLSITR